MLFQFTCGNLFLLLLSRGRRGRRLAALSPAVSQRGRPAAAAAVGAEARGRRAEVGRVGRVVASRGPVRGVSGRISRRGRRGRRGQAELVRICFEMEKMISLLFFRICHMGKLPFS